MWWVEMYLMCQHLSLYYTNQLFLFNNHASTLNSMPDKIIQLVLYDLFHISTHTNSYQFQVEICSDNSCSRNTQAITTNGSFVNASQASQKTFSWLCYQLATVT